MYKMYNLLGKDLKQPWVLTLELSKSRTSSCRTTTRRTPQLHCIHANHRQNWQERRMLKTGSLSLWSKHLQPPPSTLDFNARTYRRSLSGVENITLQTQSVIINFETGTWPFDYKGLDLGTSKSKSKPKPDHFETLHFERIESKVAFARKSVTGKLWLCVMSTSARWLHVQ